MKTHLDLPWIHPAFAEPVSIGVIASDYWLTSLYRVTVPLGLKLNEIDSVANTDAETLILEVTLDTLDDVLTSISSRLGQITFVVGARDCQSLHMLLLEAGASGCFFSTRQFPQLAQMLAQFTE